MKITKIETHVHCEDFEIFEVHGKFCGDVEKYAKDIYKRKRLDDVLAERFKEIAAMELRKKYKRVEILEIEPSGMIATCMLTKAYIG